ncbi:hypothetical protein HK102_008626 [Quaeritorhiza haematococci]|nr:hypothetical protein HK102_008626 [Quaeritorhiza haematococci]
MEEEQYRTAQTWKVIQLLYGTVPVEQRNLSALFGYHAVVHRPESVLSLTNPFNWEVDQDKPGSSTATPDTYNADLRFRDEQAIGGPSYTGMKRETFDPDLRSRGSSHRPLSNPFQGTARAPASAPANTEMVEEYLGPSMSPESTMLHRNISPSLRRSLSSDSSSFMSSPDSDILGSDSDEEEYDLYDSSRSFVAESTLQSGEQLPDVRFRRNHRGYSQFLSSHSHMQPQKFSRQHHHHQKARRGKVDVQVSELGSGVVLPLWNHDVFVRHALDYFAQEGNVQMCVTVMMVLKNYVDVGSAQEEEWLWAYVGKMSDRQVQSMFRPRG